MPPTYTAAALSTGVALMFVPHPVHRVARFAVIAPYTLDVAFTDGTERRIDFEPVLRGPLFGALRNAATFNAVRLDPEAGTLVWPNDADFDPSTLHDWPDVANELAERARMWEAATLME